MNILKNKKVYIHIGPPKTGTSAIQKFLTENSTDIKKYGIFYPSHAMDSNGISSGNLLEIFVRDDFGNLTFSDTLLERLMSKFEKSSCNILLLSSEFFFKNVFLIFEKIPEAIFIAYVRNPVELIESSYNQSVKRHGNTMKFEAPNSLNTHTLTLLERTVNRIGREKFILRAYGEPEFKNGSIIDDFLECLGAKNYRSLNTSKIINPSYCFEALEFKRWLNQYNMEEVSSLIDEVLQTYGGSENYSLLNEAEFLEYRNQAVDYLQKFNFRLDVDNLNSLIHRIKQGKPKRYRSQKYDSASLEKVKLYIKNHSEFLYVRICQLLYKHSHLNIFESASVTDFIGAYTIDVIGRKVNLYKLIFSKTSIRFKIRYIKAIISSILKGDKSYYRVWAIGKSQLKGGNQLKSRLGLTNEISNVALLVELANFSIVNDNLNFGYFLLNEALAIDEKNVTVLNMICDVESKLKTFAKDHH